MNLTTIERQTLELLKEGPRRRSELPSFGGGVLYGLCGRRFVDVYGTSEFRLTDAGRAALAGEAGAAPSPDDPLASDVPDPAAWAALLKASGVPTDNYQGLTIEWTVLREWRIRFSLEGMASSCEARARNINQAIRLVVAQAEGREPGR